jgi:hypothetical protein
MIFKFKNRTTLTIVGIMCMVNSFSQLNVDLGADTIYCKGLYKYQPDTSYIGSNVQVDGGVPPYKYSWICDYWAGSILLHARHFLNDTTAINPYFHDLPLDQDSMLFALIIEDSIGQRASDSI